MPMRKYDLDKYCWQCPQMQEKEEALIKGYCNALSQIKIKKW